MKGGGVRVVVLSAEAVASQVGGETGDLTALWDTGSNTGNTGSTTAPPPNTPFTFQKQTGLWGVARGQA